MKKCQLKKHSNVSSVTGSLHHSKSLKLEGL